MSEPVSALDTVLNQQRPAPSHRPNILRTFWPFKMQWGMWPCSR